MIALLFAVEHEAQQLLEELQKAEVDAESFAIGTLACTTGQMNGKSVVVGIIGMGEESARRQTELLLKHFTPQCVILAGYAGALVPELQHGEVILADNYSGSGLSFAPRLASSLSRLRLVSAPGVISDSSSRAKLHEETGACLVDMETRAVAEVVTSKEIPFLSVRVISDTFQEVLPGQSLAASYDLTSQSPTPFRLFWHLLAHPSEVGPFLSFVGRLGKAREKLTSALMQGLFSNEPP